MNHAGTPQILTQGHTIQWYQIEKLLGCGGFGVTYLATDNNLDHRVAIKEYLPAALVERQRDKSLVPVSEPAVVLYRKGLERFLSEARTLVKFRHKNIVRVMTVFEANNTAYLVMEYEEGARFRESVTRQGGADEIVLKHLVLDIIDGLEQVHQYGFIHRDIKPVNIIIRRDGSPVLLDFGASRDVNAGEDRPPTSFVSAGFTPLEQYQEGIGMIPGPWTDIYSLAATLYYAIGGQVPVSAVSRLASFVKQTPDPLTPATEVGHGKYSSEFLEAIDWALQFKTEDRPQTVGQWREAIIAAEPLTSKLPKSSLDNHRRSHQLQQAGSDGGWKLSIRGWLVGLAVLLTGVIVSHQLWAFIERREIRLIFQEADLAFKSELYLQEARPRYLRILDIDPHNSVAIRRVQEIDGQVETQIVGLARDGQFGAADLALSEYALIQPENAARLRGTIALIQRAYNANKQLELTRADIDSGNYSSALSRLAALKLSGVRNADTVALEQRAITARDLSANRERAEAARSALLEQQQLQNQQRLAEANERQRRRRSDYRRYLNHARLALQNNNFVIARKWLDSATAMQINDNELAELKTRLETAEKYLGTPLSAYEVSYAQAKFSALRRAVEQKNVSAMGELVERGSSRSDLFMTLFKRYSQITARIIDIKPELNPKRVTATLRIEKMALPNGDIVYPSASYRDSELSMERRRFSWSEIQW